MILQKKTEIVWSWFFIRNDKLWILPEVKKCEECKVKMFVLKKGEKMFVLLLKLILYTPMHKTSAKFIIFFIFTSFNFQEEKLNYLIEAKGENKRLGIKKRAIEKRSKERQSNYYCSYITKNRDYVHLVILYVYRSF